MLTILADHPVFVVIVVAVLAPFVAEIPLGVRIPVVVLEVVLGIVVGPHVLGLVHASEFLTVMRSIGTGAVLFLAGMEIDFEKIRGRPLLLALPGWLLSAGLAFAVVGVLHLIPGVHAPMMVAIALATTGLGALLPMLRDGGLLETPFGRHLLAAGTIGEVAPIVAASLVLSTRYSALQEFGFLLVLLALVGLAAAVGFGARPPRLLALLGRAMESSTQLPVRLALLVLGAFMVLSVEFGFEGILGAFAAGMVVGIATRGEAGRPFRDKVDALCFGWFTPFFFIGTGVHFDLGALTREATTMVLVPAFLAMFLLVRGASVYLYRNDLPTAQRWPFACSASVASLGLVVVITEIGLQTKSMSPDIAQALVGASLLSLLLYTTLAGALLSRAAPVAPTASSS